MSESRVLRGSQARRRPQSLLTIAVLLTMTISGCSKNATVPAVSSDQTGPDRESELRVLGKLPEFKLTDQLGNDVELGEFMGRVWIGNFIFTRCLTTCPRQTAKLALLQEDLKMHPSWSDIRLVSITVDPEYDRPEILNGYARNHKADYDHWKFLTGPREAIWSLSKDGFKLAVGDDPKAVDRPIFHSPHFVLVDRVGQVRGYYDSGNDQELKKLKAGLEVLLAEPPSHGDKATASDETTELLPAVR